MRNTGTSTSSWDVRVECEPIINSVGVFSSRRGSSTPCTEKNTHHWPTYNFTSHQYVVLWPGDENKEIHQSRLKINGFDVLQNLRSYNKENHNGMVLMGFKRACLKTNTMYPMLLLWTSKINHMQSSFTHKN